jgi:hypothetical protein
MTGDVTGPQLEAFRRRFESELTPAIEEFVVVACQAVERLAKRDGWSAAQAARLVEQALPPILQDLAAAVPPEQALEGGYQKARRALSAKIFEDTIAEGSTRDTAFLTLVELERALARRRGEPAADYSDALLIAGCQAAAAAAHAGASTIEQIDTGFGMMRRLAQGT